MPEPDLVTSDSAKPGVTVIIATALAPHRAALLDRAIESARAQAAVTEIVVVVNGERFDRAALARLQARAELRVEYLKVGSYPAAQRRGRELVTQPFFCYLDDDDELLPGSVDRRLELALSSGADVVVGNGYRSINGADVPFCRRLPDRGDDLAMAMFNENWFASCAPLFNTASVTLDFFDGHTKYLEWTLILFKLLAAGKRFDFVPHFGFRIYDTATSLSKDEQGVFAAPEVLHAVLKLDPSPQVRRQVRTRLARAHHVCAEVELRRGRYVSAWRHHLKSLAYPGGLAYLTYTRRLFAPRFALGAGQ